MISEACAKMVRDIGNKSPGQAFVDIFNAIAADASIREVPSATLVCPMYDEACNLQPGDFAPEIHFVVRKVA